MKKALTKFRRKPAPEPSSRRVTNETVAEHREQVLGRARRFIYPLQHSKHRLVVLSTSIFLVTLVIFFTYCTLALYKFKDNSVFLYKVTQVIPFPLGRIGSDFVAYENYLFEINHYTHYYRTQQSLDFNSDAGKQQLVEFKKRAFEKVVNDAYVKKIAAEKGISVSDQEVDARIATVREQNRLGANSKEFETVLKDFWNWSESDFRRSLKSQILSEKVVSSLDTASHDKANAAQAQLKNGKDFAELAREVSEEPASGANGGEYGFLIEKTSRDINPLIVDSLSKLQDGQYSDIIDLGDSLEIVKKVQAQPDGKVQASHIVFYFKDINQHLNDRKVSQPAVTYVNF